MNLITNQRKNGSISSPIVLVRLGPATTSREHVALSHIDRCAIAALMNEEFIFSKHFLAIETATSTRVIIRISNLGLFWAPEPEDDERVSIYHIDDLLSHTTYTITPKEYASHSMVPEAHKIDITTTLDRNVEFICKQVEAMNDAVSRMLATPLATGMEWMASLRIKDDAEQYSREEFKILCARFHQYVSSHHMKDRKHVTAGTINDVLNSRQQLVSKSEEHNLEVLTRASVIIMIGLSPIGGCLVGLIGLPILIHNAREEMNNKPDAHIFYYHGEFFGVVLDTEEKQNHKFKDDPDEDPPLFKTK